MTTYVALLRGIKVGGKNLIKMPALKAGFEAEAFDYIPTVVVRSRAQMRSVVEKAPKGFGSEPETYRYDVLFLKEPLTARAALKHVPTNPAVDKNDAGTGVLYHSRLTARATASRLSQISGSPIY